ncbi:hypothetical protein JCM18899A_02740 [Nocardioides sp. AN3]
MILAEVASGSKSDAARVRSSASPPRATSVVEAGSAGLADGSSAAVVLVVGSDVADALVEPDRVVVAPEAVELGLGSPGSTILSRWGIRP